MAETILTPGKDNSSNIEQTPTIDPGYLVKDNLLSEFKTEAEKSKVRGNLGVLPAENTYTREDVNKIIVDKITNKLDEHISDYDHITPEEVTDMLVNFVRNDGSTPFTAPQSGKTPTSDSHLTTKAYVDRLILSCLKSSDKTKILEQVANTLRNYAKLEDVYNKDQIEGQIEDLIKDLDLRYIKLDGTTPFESPLSGRTPQISSHLTTKGYVDNLLRAHEEDIDPHGFTEKLNKRLKKYILKENVYDRTLTYSRGQIDLIIDKLVDLAVEEALKSHEDLDDPHGILEKVSLLGCIYKDGSIAFTAPQKGVDGVGLQDLTTLRQLKQLESKVKQDIKNIPEPIWKTSGPVESTVGFVEDNTPLHDVMTLQEIMDAIFYGKSISLDVPEYVIISNPCPITMCIHGSTGLVLYAELYQEGELIYTFLKEDFENGCITIDSSPLFLDTEFTFKVFYTNDSVHEETKIAKCSLPIFIGILPKWKFGNTVTYEYLLELANEDSVNNKFYHKGGENITITHKYDFTDESLMHLMAVIPESYPDLYQMQIPSQLFGKEAFDIIDMIPFQIPGVDKDIIYKIYIYRQALYTANLETTFKFKKQ